MGKAKRLQTKGRLGLSKVFQEFSEGDSVAVIKEPSSDSKFPLRLQGFTGRVIDKRGRSYMVEIRTQNKHKKFIIEPMHLSRIKHDKE